MLADPHGLDMRMQAPHWTEACRETLLKTINRSIALSLSFELSPISRSFKESDNFLRTNKESDNFCILFLANVVLESSATYYRLISHCWHELNRTREIKSGKAKFPSKPRRRNGKGGNQRAQRFRPSSSFAAGTERKGSGRSGDGDPRAEWAVVELQASFAGDIRGLHIGRLCSAPSPSSSASKARTPAIPSMAAVVTAWVHLHGGLAGTKVTLKKPLLVLKKKKVSGGGGAVDSPAAAAAELEQELEVIGVIRHKILFKDRPKALISKPVTKEKKTVQPAAN